MIYQSDITVLSRAFKNISLAGKKRVSYFPELPLRVDVESCLKNRTSLFLSFLQRDTEQEKCGRVMQSNC